MGPALQHPRGRRRRDARLIPIPGNPPSLLNPPSGCSFHPRCAHVDKVPGDLCRTELPELTPASRGGYHVKRCHLANPEQVYATEVLPEIAPDLVEENCMSDVNVDKPDATDDPGTPEAPAAPAPGPSSRRGRAVPTSPSSPSGHTPPSSTRRPPVLEVENLKMYFPVRSLGPDPAHHRPRAGRRRHLLPGARGRIPGPGGRVRLRQVDDRPADHPAVRPRPAGR